MRQTGHFNKGGIGFQYEEKGFIGFIVNKCCFKKQFFSHISYNGYGAKIKPINTGVI
jgi:hypothetical protein